MNKAYRLNRIHHRTDELEARRRDKNAMGDVARQTLNARIEKYIETYNTTPPDQRIGLHNYIDMALQDTEAEAEKRGAGFDAQVFFYERLTALLQQRAEALLGGGS